MADEIFRGTQRYRLRTEGSDYLLTVERTAGRRRAILEGYSSRLGEEIYVEDKDAEVDGRSLFSTPAAEWLGRSLKVGHIRTSEVRSIASADGEWGDAGTRITRVTALIAPRRDDEPTRRTAAPRGSPRSTTADVAPVAARGNAAGGEEGLVLSAEAGTFRDIKHALEWQLHVTDGLTFAAARALASKLGAKEGWRLPTPEELKTLLRSMWGANAPWVWTSAAHAADLDLAVAFWPATNEVRAWLRSNAFAVRCVRTLS